jgi:hypothetical protein
MRPDVTRDGSSLAFAADQGGEEQYEILLIDA